MIPMIQAINQFKKLDETEKLSSMSAQDVWLLAFSWTQEELIKQMPNPLLQGTQGLDLDAIRQAAERLVRENQGAFFKNNT